VLVEFFLRSHSLIYIASHFINERAVFHSFALRVVVLLLAKCIFRFYFVFVSFGLIHWPQFHKFLQHFTFDWLA
jgi:hypothetical protein